MEGHCDWTSASTAPSFEGRGNKSSPVATFKFPHIRMAPVRSSIGRPKTPVWVQVAWSLFSASEMRPTRLWAIIVAFDGLSLHLLFRLNISVPSMPQAAIQRPHLLGRFLCLLYTNDVHARKFCAALVAQWSSPRKSAPSLTDTGRFSKNTTCRFVTGCYANICRCLPAHS